MQSRQLAQNLPGTQGLAHGIQANNPGYAIPDSKVLGFASISDANAFLLDNPFAMAGGVHFTTDAIGGIGYMLQTNGSVRKLLHQQSYDVICTALKIAPVPCVCAVAVWDLDSSHHTLFASLAAALLTCAAWEHHPPGRGFSSCLTVLSLFAGAVLQG